VKVFRREFFELLRISTFKFEKVWKRVIRVENNWIRGEIAHSKN
jgi:hypothetical protein